jgi:hypothetical protein
VELPHIEWSYHLEKEAPMGEINWRNSEARHAAYGPASRLWWLDVPPKSELEEDVEGADDD